MSRCVRPELLDSLPPASAEATRSRRELVRVNRVMGNAAWFLRRVPPLARPGERALELGAGDGALSLALTTAGLPCDALDRFPAPDTWPDANRWQVCDLRTYTRWSKHALILGNLILHHLHPPELAALGERLDREPGVRVLVFNEPLRHFRSHVLWTLGAPLGGAGPVTRHDGRVSITAGFRADELPRALGLSSRRWSWAYEHTWLGAYRVIATRRR